MLNTLMDISEAETGTMKLHLEEVNILKGDRGCGRSLPLCCGGKKISIQTPSTRRAFPDCRPEQVTAGFANLLDNAIKYTQAVGGSMLRFLKTPISAVIVKDNGIGSL
jgi:signal transduction histidine kinase